MLIRYKCELSVVVDAIARLPRYLKRQCTMPLAT